MRYAVSWLVSLPCVAVQAYNGLRVIYDGIFKAYIAQVNCPVLSDRLEAFLSYAEYNSQRKAIAAINIGLTIISGEWVECLNIASQLQQHFFNAFIRGLNWHGFLHWIRA